MSSHLEPEAIFLRMSTEKIGNGWKELILWP
jgi:hypothetical protein